jgi:hypothetical protein
MKAEQEAAALKAKEDALKAKEDEAQQKSDDVWTKDQQSQLEAGMKEFGSNLPTKERW